MRFFIKHSFLGTLVILVFNIAYLHSAQVIPSVTNTVVWERNGMILIDTVWNIEEYVTSRHLADSAILFVGMHTVRSLGGTSSGDVMLINSNTGDIVDSMTVCNSVRRTHGSVSLLTASCTDSINIICFACADDSVHMIQYPSMTPIVDSMLHGYDYGMISRTGRYMLLMVPEEVPIYEVNYGDIVIYDRYTNNTAHVYGFWGDGIQFGEGDNYVLIPSIDANSGLQRGAVFDLSNWVFVGDTTSTDSTCSTCPSVLIASEGGHAKCTLSTDGQTVYTISSSTYMNGPGLFTIRSLSPYTLLYSEVLDQPGSYKETSLGDEYSYALCLSDDSDQYVIERPTYDSTSDNYVYRWVVYSALSNTPSHIILDARIGLSTTRIDSGSNVFLRTNFPFEGRMYMHTLDLPAPVFERRSTLAHVYPNPSTSTVSISAADGILFDRVEVSDVRGDRIMTKAYDDATNIITLSTSTFVAGTYFVRLYVDEILVIQTLFIVE